MEKVQTSFKKLKLEFNEITTIESLEEFPLKIQELVADWKGAARVKVVPGAPKRIIKKVIPVATQVKEEVKEVTKVEAKKKAVSETSSTAATTEETKKVGRPVKTDEEKAADKVAKEKILASSGAVPSPKNKTCGCRVHGTPVDIPGSKAPRGGQVKAYEPKECEKTAKFMVGSEDDGYLYMCTTCHTHYAYRTTKPKEWNGFFDDDEIPDASHIVNSAWYRKKAAGSTSETGSEVE
jgi:RNase H-fold protein (predicted Holliday junction resolvase)